MVYVQRYTTCSQRAGTTMPTSDMPMQSPNVRPTLHLVRQVPTHWIMHRWLTPFMRTPGNAEESNNHRNSNQNSIASTPTIKHDVFESKPRLVTRRLRSTQTTPPRNNHARHPPTAHCSPSTRDRSTQTSPHIGTSTTLTTVLKSCIRTPVTQSTSAF